MRIIDILRKDLKIILSDKKSLASMILMPVIISSILSFALSGSFGGGVSGNTSQFQIAIVKEYDDNEQVDKIHRGLTSSLIAGSFDDEQRSEIVENALDLDIEEIFFEQFLGNEELKKVVSYRVEDRESAMELIRNRDVAAVVILPEDFIYDMTINLTTPFRNIVDIQVIGNTDYIIGSEVAESIMSGFADMTSSMIIGKNIFIETALSKGANENAFEDIDIIIDNISGIMDNSGANVDYIQLEGKTPVNSFQYYAVAMTTMFILYAAGYGSRTLLEEKDNITYQRMIIAGTPQWKIASGKFFMMFIFAFLQILVMVTYSSLVLNVNWGNLINVVIVSLFIIFSVAGLGTMIAAATFKAGNYKMASVFDNLIIQIMALIGGSFIPLEVLPRFIQNLSFLSINGIALKSYLRIMMGYDLGSVVSYISALLGLGIVFIAIAIFILKRKEGLRHA